MEENATTPTDEDAQTDSYMSLLLGVSYGIRAGLCVPTPKYEDELEKCRQALKEIESQDVGPPTGTFEEGDEVRLSPSFGGGRGLVVGPFSHSSYPVKLLDDGPDFKRGAVFAIAPICMAPIKEES